MNEAKDIERGALAESVLSNRVFLESFEALEAKITTEWKQAKCPSEREKLHLSLMLLKRLESHLKSLVMNGDVAGRVVERKNSLLERVGLRSAQY
jgi:hypothetical protein